MYVTNESIVLKTWNMVLQKFVALIWYVFDVCILKIYVIDKKKLIDFSSSKKNQQNNLLVSFFSRQNNINFVLGIQNKNHIFLI